MKFKLDTTIPVFKDKITHKDRCLFMGSCFSDEISSKFSLAGFDVLSNPFGTIFHPIPLAWNINYSIDLQTEHFIFKNKDSYYSWNASSVLRHPDRRQLIDMLEKQRSLTQDYLKTAHYLFVTLGSAWGYRHQNENLIVANCHKQPFQLFQKVLSPLEELTEIWSETLVSIYQCNPSIQIVFTVSPVRHTKDGLIENNRSKSRLFELIANLEEKFPLVYFPSYEIVVDELRDYRFFKADLVHPNEMAIDYVWEGIKDTFFESNTLQLTEEVERLRKWDKHIIQSNDPIERSQFEQQKKNKIAAFLKENPPVKW